MIHHYDVINRPIYEGISKMNLTHPSLCVNGFYSQNPIRRQEISNHYLTHHYTRCSGKTLLMHPDDFFHHI